jgi:hypothetical protein
MLRAQLMSAVRQKARASRFAAVQSCVKAVPQLQLLCSSCRSAVAIPQLPFRSCRSAVAVPQLPFRGCHSAVAVPRLCSSAAVLFRDSLFAVRRSPFAVTKAT